MKKTVSMMLILTSTLASSTGAWAQTAHDASGTSAQASNQLSAASVMALNGTILLASMPFVVVGVVLTDAGAALMGSEIR